METGLKVILFSVAVIMVAGLIGMGLYYYNTGMKANSQASSSIASSLSELSDADKKLYDNSIMSGDQVISAIAKYNDDPNTSVIVCTKNNGTAEWTLYDAAVKGDNGDATITAYSTLVKNCVNFPLKDANGNQVSTDESSSKVAEAISGKIKASKTETGGYNATLDSTDSKYIAQSATFTSSLQIDENNAVRFVTFVQK